MEKRFLNKPNKTSIRRNVSVIAEPLELVVSRMINNNEPIGSGTTDLIYTRREDGVAPELDIRTDRMDLAIETKDKERAEKIAKRDAIPQAKDNPSKTAEGQQSSDNERGE